MFKHGFFKEETRKTDQEIREFIKNTNKPLVYTYGYAWKSPTTYRVPIDKEEALKRIERNSLTDITEEDEVIHINQFSENDMW